jgi:hypothetical protein
MVVVLFQFSYPSDYEKHPFRVGVQPDDYAEGHTGEGRKEDGRQTQVEGDVVIMTRVFTRLRSIAQSMGLCRALVYVVFTVILERIGFHLNYVFERKLHHGGSPMAPTGFTVKPAREISDLSAQDLQALQQYGGDGLIEGFLKAFEAKKFCVVLRSATDKLATVCWVERVDSFAPCSASPCILVARCFTLQQFRGMGLYPAALKTIDALLPNEMRQLEKLVIECSTFNFASRSGIMKAGFQISGKAMEVGRKRITWRKKQ